MGFHLILFSQFLFCLCWKQSGGYTMPVTMPVNPGPYGDPGSMLHASPQMVGGHSSVSPRPASSTGMLDVGGSNNGYGSSQPASSPIPESPTPPPPPPSALRSSSSMANRSLSPQQQHLAGSQRHNLRLAIPGNQAGLAISSHDRGKFHSRRRFTDGLPIFNLSQVPAAAASYCVNGGNRSMATDCADISLISP
jgi:hypothetical protein